MRFFGAFAPLCRGQIEPFIRLHIILRHVFARNIHHAQIALSGKDINATPITMMQMAVYFICFLLSLLIDTPITHQ